MEGLRPLQTTPGKGRRPHTRRRAVALRTSRGMGNEGRRRVVALRTSWGMGNEGRRRAVALRTSWRMGDEGRRGGGRGPPDLPGKGRRGETGRRARPSGPPGEWETRGDGAEGAALRTSRGRGNEGRRGGGLWPFGPPGEWETRGDGAEGCGPSDLPGKGRRGSNEAEELDLRTLRGRGDGGATKRRNWISGPYGDRVTGWYEVGRKNPRKPEAQRSESADAAGSGNWMQRMDPTRALAETPRMPAAQPLHLGSSIAEGRSGVKCGKGVLQDKSVGRTVNLRGGTDEK